jgi:hypothetical protein
MNTPKNKPLNRKVEQHKLSRVLPKSNIPTLSELLLPQHLRLKNLRYPLRLSLEIKNANSLKEKLENLNLLEEKCYVRISPWVSEES